MRVAVAAIVVLILEALSKPALAQTSSTPYAGERTREIKALSPEEIARYLEGHGMGFALAAELNRHPGPKHVLELAKELGLDARQARKTQAIYDAMHARAVALGRDLVAKERELDRLFASGSVDAAGRARTASLAAAVREIARLQGEIRLAHLAAHVETRAVLTPAQIAKYDELRGYGKSDAPVEHDPSRHH